MKSHSLVVPNVDGRVGQDLAIAVPAAVGGGTAASRVVSADLAEDLAFAMLLQVQLQVRVALAVTRREAETPHSVDLDKGQVKLCETREGGDHEGDLQETGATMPGAVIWLKTQIVLVRKQGVSLWYFTVVISWLNFFITYQATKKVIHSCYCGKFLLFYVILDKQTRIWLKNIFQFILTVWGQTIG